MRPVHLLCLFIAVSSSITGRATAVPTEYAVMQFTEPGWDVQIPEPPAIAGDVILIPVDTSPVHVEEDAVEDADLPDRFVPRMWELPERTPQRSLSDEVPSGDILLTRMIARALTSPDDDIEELASRLLSGAPPRRTLKSTVVDDDDDPVVSRVLEEPEEVEKQRVRRRRSVLNVVVKRGAEAAEGSPVGEQRADETTAAPSGFLETIQGQLPGQLQGLGGAMENSEMVVGTFQAVIMPGSAATDLGQQIQGFISNMPQVPQLPQLPGGGG